MEAIAEASSPDEWSRCTIEEGSKGPIVADLAALRVIAVRDELPGPEVWSILRRNVETGIEESKQLVGRGITRCADGVAGTII